MKRNVQTVNWFAMLLALALLWAMPVKATDYDLFIAGRQVKAKNCNDLTVIDGVSIAEGGIFKYDPNSKTLIMKDVNIMTSGKRGIENDGIEGLKIEVSGENRIFSDRNYTLCLYASTQIVGNGSLELGSNDDYSSVLFKLGNITLTICDISLVVVSKKYEGINGSSTKTSRNLILRNAKVKAVGPSGGIVNLTSFITEGCRIVSPEGAKFDAEKHAVVDKEGNEATEIFIERTATIAVTGVTVSPTTVDLKERETKQLTISVEPASATNKSYTCKSDNEGVATVNNSGLVTAVGVGTATITVTTEDGSKTARCTVNVLDENGELPLNSLSLDYTELRVEVNKTVQLTVGYNPSGTTQKGVVWSSANPQIATVENGLVKGIAEGQTTITVTSQAKPNESISCTVTVIPPTAVEDVLFAGISVAPNPFASQLKIKNEEAVNARYELVNTSGVVVRSGVLQGVETVLNTQNLTAGAYLLRIIAGSENKTLRVVKE